MRNIQLEAEMATKVGFIEVVYFPLFGGWNCTNDEFHVRQRRVD